MKVDNYNWARNSEIKDFLTELNDNKLRIKIYSSFVEFCQSNCDYKNINNLCDWIVNNIDTNDSLTVIRDALSTRLIDYFLYCIGEDDKINYNYTEIIQIIDSEGIFCDWNYLYNIIIENNL